MDQEEGKSFILYHCQKQKAILTVKTQIEELRQQLKDYQAEVKIEQESRREEYRNKLIE